MMIFLARILAASSLFLAFAVHAQAVQGNAQAGQSINAMCIGCHGIVGYKASFPSVYNVPMISGQSAKYIEAALKAYQKGDRKHPTMRGIAQTLTDQNIADLAAYYSRHGVVQGQAVSATTSKIPAANAQVTALLGKANCASCHGANFSQPIDLTYPKIAGQHADYLYVALLSYKNEPGTVVGRTHPIMGALAKQYERNELKLLADYIASVPGELKVVPQNKLR